MSAAILHFGEEITECFPYLRRSGYVIHCFTTSVAANQVQQPETVYDLVSSSDLESEACWIAAAEARKHLLVPSVFFRAPLQARLPQVEQRTAGVETSDYDLVIPADESPDSWIPGLDALIARGRRFRHASERIIANSLQLRQQTARVIERTNLEIARAESLCEQSETIRTVSNAPADRSLKCSFCGEDFVFTANEQLLFQARGAGKIPDNCGRCNIDSAGG